MNLEEQLILIMDLSYAASWIVLAVVILRWLMQKAPKSQRLFMWLFVALRLVSQYYLPSSKLSIVPNLGVVPVNITETKVPGIDTGFQTVNSLLNPIIEKNFTPEPDALVTPMQKFFDVAIVVWFIGVIAMFLYAIISFIILRIKIKEATPLKNNVMICDHIDTAFVLGIIRPKIYIPSNLNGGDMECVIAHEKAHIKRGDHIWKLIGYLLLSIYWFNPVMWLAFNLFCKDIELACDAKVLKRTTDFYKKFYSKALINCSSAKKRIVTCPLAFSENAVESRIKSILNYKKPKVWLALVGVVVCFSMSFVSFSGNSSFVGYQEYKSEITEEQYKFIEKELLERARCSNDRINIDYYCTAFTVLEVREKNDLTTFYMVSRSNGYAVNNGVVECNHRSVYGGVSAITAEYSDGNYELIEFWYPGDGEVYWEDIHEKFPSYLWNYLMHNEGEIRGTLQTKCEIKAQEKLLKKTASECFVDSEAEAIEIAKKLCTVEYDEISVEYFGEGWTPKEYEVTFLKNGGSEYGEQSVWITENGIVEHITYWD